VQPLARSPAGRELRCQVLLFVGAEAVLCVGLVTFFRWRKWL